MLAEQWQVDSEDRIVLFEFYLLKFLLDLFVNSVWDGIFGQEKQELEYQEWEGSERNDFEYGKDVVFESEENGEDDPFGAELFELFSVGFGWLKLEDNSIYQNKISNYGEDGGSKVIKWHWS